MLSLPSQCHVIEPPSISTLLAGLLRQISQNTSVTAPRTAMTTAITRAFAQPRHAARANTMTRKPASTSRSERFSWSVITGGQYPGCGRTRRW